jgi:hypothetical protein
MTTIKSKKIAQDELRSIIKYITKQAPVSLTTLAARNLVSHIAAMGEALDAERKIVDLLYHTIRAVPCGQRLMDAADTAERLISDRENFDL